jgi:hypothetical protein
MPLYYFDTRDDRGFVRDDTGLEFDTLEQAKAEAARALVDMARDRVPGPDRRSLLWRFVTKINAWWLKRGS